MVLRPEPAGRQAVGATTRRSPDIAEQRSALLAIDTRLSEARERQFTQLSKSIRRVEEQQRTLAGLEERRDRLRIVTSPRAGFI